MWLRNSKSRVIEQRSSEFFNTGKFMPHIYPELWSWIEFIEISATSSEWFAINFGEHPTNLGIKAIDSQTNLPVVSLFQVAIAVNQLSQPGSRRQEQGKERLESLPVVVFSPSQVFTDKFMEQPVTAMHSQSEFLIPDDTVQVCECVCVCVWENFIGFL